MRLKGIYLAIATLAFNVIVEEVTARGDTVAGLEDVMVDAGGDDSLGVKSGEGGEVAEAWHREEYPDDRAQDPVVSGVRVLDDDEAGRVVAVGTAAARGVFCHADFG